MRRSWGLRQRCVLLRDGLVWSVLQYDGQQRRRVHVHVRQGVLRTHMRPAMCGVGRHCSV